MLYMSLLLMTFKMWADITFKLQQEILFLTANITAIFRHRPLKFRFTLIRK